MQGFSAKLLAGSRSSPVDFAVERVDDLAMSQKIFYAECNKSAS
jgi:hypothetical protein